MVPRSGPFLLFVFYFETVFNAFYMKGRGELARSPLCANVLFIIRVSEISCEVEEEGQRWACGKGIRRILNIPRSPGLVSRSGVCSSQREATEALCPPFKVRVWWSGDGTWEGP